MGKQNNILGTVAMALLLLSGNRAWGILFGFSESYTVDYPFLIYPGETKVVHSLVVTDQGSIVRHTISSDPANIATLPGGQEYVDYFYDLNGSWLDTPVFITTPVDLSPGQYSVQNQWEVMCTDTSGGTIGLGVGGLCTVHILVLALPNTAPVADAGPDRILEATSPAGASVTLNGSASIDDGQLQPLTYTWTWAGGSATGVNPTVTVPLGATTVTLEVFDGQLSDTDAVDVIVQDTTPPEVFIGSPAQNALYAAGSLELDFWATDVVGVSDLSGTLGDAAGYCQQVDPGYVPGPGVYTLVVTAVDAAGNSAESEPVFFVVYDPTGGFVTGGGWIDSSEGAYAPDPLLTGKANFGFVSKYKKGATVPTGQTDLVFQAGDLNFHSSSYDWLVVTGSNYARFKGIGTINGYGAYKFMLWAGDGAPDTFRIKIWWEDSETENVVYDNGMDQPIGGGSIVIHTK